MEIVRRTTSAVGRDKPKNTPKTVGLAPREEAPVLLPSHKVHHGGGLLTEAILQVDADANHLVFRANKHSTSLATLPKRTIIVIAAWSQHEEKRTKRETSN